MSSIVIGKHTLESLTSGMYSDPYVVFREYIQNSVDSIDEAIRAGVMIQGSEQIIVKVRFRSTSRLRTRCWRSFPTWGRRRPEKLKRR